MNGVNEERSQAIEIYRSERGDIELRVRLEGDTVWLSQSQMALLFGRDRTVITRHINNCYKEGELDRNITCAKFAHVGSEADQVYETTLYNLDVIISVGYRVKSLNGTRFRQWADSILKQYLVKGYAVNTRLQAERYEELKGLVRVMARTIESRAGEPGDETEDVVRTVKDYVYALDTLDGYDNQQLSISDTLFLWFMEKNGLLHRPDGSKRIADATLVALTLMIAESRPQEKDMMVSVTVNLINKRNK